MENKILVKLIIPELDRSFDVFLPVNEVVWKIKKMIVKCVNDIVSANFNMNCEYLLIKKDNILVYNNNEIIIDTDIRNTAELLLISK